MPIIACLYMGRIEEYGKVVTRKAGIVFVFGSGKPEQRVIGTRTVQLISCSIDHCDDSVKKSFY